MIRVRIGGERDLEQPAIISDHCTIIRFHDHGFAALIGAHRKHDHRLFVIRKNQSGKLAAFLREPGIIGNTDPEDVAIGGVIRINRDGADTDDPRLRPVLCRTCRHGGKNRG